MIRQASPTLVASAESPLEQQARAYRRLRIAGERFERDYRQLDDAARAEVERIAEREVRLEQAVLASREALQAAVSASQVEAACAAIRGRYEDEAAFAQSLAEHRLSVAALRQALDRELRVAAVLELVGAQVPESSDTDVGLYYYLHPERFLQPESRSVRHILITVNADFAENLATTARQRLETIRRRVLRRPRRFAEQALKHSECPSALQEGHLGQVSRGTLYAALDEVLFSMAEGDISEIVESPVGLHLLFCERIHPATILPLQAVMPNLRAALDRRRRSDYQKQWIRSQLAGESGGKQDGRPALQEDLAWSTAEGPPDRSAD